MEGFAPLTEIFRSDLPLALGWPIAIWLIIQNNKLHAKLVEVVSINSEAMTRLADKIGALKSSGKDDD